MFKGIELLPVLLLLLFTGSTALSQRCGDSLFLYLRDENGKVLAPTDFESVHVSASYEGAHVSELVSAEPQIRQLPDGVKSFAVRVVCGITAAEFVLKRKGRLMRIRVLNIPGDAGHVLLDGIPFRSGIYEVDLGGRPMKNVEKNQGGVPASGDPPLEVEWLIKEGALRRIADVN